MQVLTNSEKLLLSSVGVFAISLTAIVIFCVVRKSCWLHKAIWEDDKKKKQRMDDIICIRYPPDIYPTSLGVYRENAFRSPEEELARLFYSPLKRDSTYSSMSDRSSNSSVGLEMSSPHNSSGSNTTTMGSPVTATAVVGTPEDQSPRHSSAPRQGNNAAVNVKSLSNVKSSSPMVPVPVVPIPIAGHADHRFSMPHFSNGTGFYRSTVAALAAEAAVAANRRFSLQPGMSLSHPNARQPFFTFILKYEEDNGLVNIEFIEARNLPQKEYLAQPSDAFFTLEIQPRKPADRKKDVLRYRFVTRTIKKAGEICDFSETFLAQLAKSHLNEYVIKFTAFDQDRFGNPNEIGTTTLSFEDFKDFTSNKLVLSCSLKEPLSKRGDIMLGMCYLPTAERMSVTIVKLNNLNPFFTDGMISKQSICYVRLLLLRADSGKVIRKKKTTFQKLTGTTANQPVFNETIVFDMPPNELVQVVLLALVCLTDKPPISKSQRREESQEHESTAFDGSRKSVPEHHPNLVNKTSNESSLFHYSDNLNVKAKRLDSSSSGQSHSSQGSGPPANYTKYVGGSSSDQSTRVTTTQNLDTGTLQTNAASPESNSSGIGSLEGCEEEKPLRVKDTVVGKVALGYCIRNPLGKFHWENMMRNPRNVVTEWHGLK